MAAITAGTGVAAAPQGTPTVYNLSKGQYVQFTQGAELTGSAILANNPIAVFGGNSCMNVPATEAACDTGGQQSRPYAPSAASTPPSATGAERRAERSVPWRLVGAVNGTKLTWTPSAPSGAPPP